MTDEEMLTVIAAVCDFDRAGVERWRREALIIGRAVERAALERAAQLCDENIDPAEAAFEIRALIDAQSGEEVSASAPL
ncbi:hypothetical protein [Caballeronia zhejiangensis]|uniref:hypothetical protein n=1 Tax=Caballeronia zhejiangensis TaxID=871203 RepID=UPI001FD1A91C|nr:hypothetical protein [Caballeronia zhejiangensis]